MGILLSMLSYKARTNSRNFMTNTLKTFVEIEDLKNKIEKQEREIEALTVELDRLRKINEKKD